LVVFFRVDWLGTNGKFRWLQFHALAVNIKNGKVNVFFSTIFKGRYFTHCHLYHSRDYVALATSLVHRERRNGSASIESQRQLPRAPHSMNAQGMENTFSRRTSWVNCMDVGTEDSVFQTGNHIYPKCCRQTCRLRAALCAQHRRCLIHLLCPSPITIPNCEEAFVKAGLEQPHPYPNFSLSPKPRSSGQIFSNDQIP
jgi:hypothetical protein